MKRLKKLLYIFVTLIILCTPVLMAGCQKNKTGGDGGGAGASAKSNVLNFRDFEQWGPDFQITRLLKSFGKFSRNSDPAYVHSGKYSAKIQPMGGYYSYTEPMMYFETISSYFDYDYSDFRKVEYVSMWFYNAEKTEKTVTVGLVTSITDFNNVVAPQGMTYTLEPGKWQEVTYYVDFSAMNISMTVTEEMMGSVRGIYLSFVNAKTPNLDEAPVIYLDDVTIGYKDTPNTVEQVLKFENGEICDFEQIYQKYVFVPATQNVNEKCVSILDVVKGSDVGVDPSSGNNMLRLTARSGDTPRGSWPGFNLPRNILLAAGFGSYPQDEWSKTYFAFDVYNPQYDGDFTFSLVFRQGTGSYKYTPTVVARTRTWVTFRISLETLASTSSYDGSSPYDGYVYGGRVTNPANLFISYAEFVSNQTDANGELVPIEKYFYFDNFRLYQTA